MAGQTHTPDTIDTVPTSNIAVGMARLQGIFSLNWRLVVQGTVSYSMVRYGMVGMVRYGMAG